MRNNRWRPNPYNATKKFNAKVNNMKSINHTLNVRGGIKL